MGLCPSQQKIPDPADAAVGGIEADQLLAPYNYLINAAAQMGTSYTDEDGVVHDFTGLGQSDTAAVVSDQMAQTLLDIQREKSPAIIAQRLEELKVADPKGYAARQALFDRIMADADANPDRPLSTATSQLIQDELAKGSGFSDNKQKQEVQDSVRGKQVGRGIFLGNSAASEEAKTVVGAGETLRNQRQQSALDLLQSGSAPEDVAYRQFQQTVANLGSFVNGQTPEAQFGQVSAASSGPVQFDTKGINTNLFDQGAAAQGINNAFNQNAFKDNQANPWMSALATAFSATGSLKQQNPSWFT